METEAPSSEALRLLARVYRERRSGLLRLGPAEAALRVVVHDGHIVGLGPDGASGAPKPRLDDSVDARLDRVLAEIGVQPAAKAATPAAGHHRASSPRARLVQALADPAAVAAFDEGAEASSEVTETAGATEPLILEAVRGLRDPETVRAALGDLDQRLVVTAAFAEERTLTLTEGYLLSRIDGTSSAREVLQLVPLDPEETERTLLGLLLTGRVEYRAAPARPNHRRPEPVPPPQRVAGPESREAEPSEPLPCQPLPCQPLPCQPLPIEPQSIEPEPIEPQSTEPQPTEPLPTEPSPSVEAIPVEDRPEGPMPEDFPQVSLVEEQAQPEPELAAEPAPLGPETRARKKEIVEVFHSLPAKNHFEVLGVEPGCTDADVKRAYAALVRRFHPDAQGDGFDDMHDFLAAILISAREALEVLETARSRAQYEAKSGIVRRPRAASPGPSVTPPVPEAPAGSAGRPGRPEPSRRLPPPAALAAALPDYVPPEQILQRARILLSQAQYWDVIQFLENAVPQMEPLRNQHKGRILLAKAYAKNPKWVRRALEYLDEVVREDATNVEAHYELGLLFKQTGQLTRAQAAFRRVLELKPEHREAAAELGLAAGPAPSGGLLKRLFRRGKAS